MNLAHTAFPRLSRSLILGRRLTVAETECSYRSSVQAIRAFTEQFTPFEWTYLCSYRWFITALEGAAYRGSFLSLQLRAQQKLVDEGLRQYRIPNRRCEPRRWWS